MLLFHLLSFTAAADTPYRFVGYDYDVWPNKPQDLSTPVGIRLGIASNSSMNVGWSSYEQLNNSCVHYGETSSNLNQTACSNSSATTYETSRLWFSAVELTGLKPDTQYFYQIDSSNSTVLNFTSTKLPGDKGAFSFAVAADMGLHGPAGYEIMNPQQFKNDTNPADLLEPGDYHISAQRLTELGDDVRLVNHIGDFAYADTALSKNPNVIAADGGAFLTAYEGLLERFYNQLGQASQMYPYFTGPGNHEAACKEVSNTDTACPKGQNNFTDYLYRHGGVMPKGFESTSQNSTARELRAKANSLAVSPMWYSYDFGMMHFAMFNTETDFYNAPDQTGSTGDDSYYMTEGPFGAPGQQLAWLEADLASVDRTITPWIIVGGHRPWYTSGYPDADDACISCQNAFEDILYKYGVDLGLFGHVHNSERYLPMYQNTPDPNGYQNPRAPMYIVAGAAGNIEGLDAKVTTKNSNTGLEWINSDFYTVVKIDIQSEKSLNISFVRSSDGKVLDSTILQKEHNVQFVRNL